MSKPAPDPSDPIVARTVRLPAGVWAEINEFRHELRLDTVNKAVETLIKTGLSARDYDL